MKFKTYTETDESLMSQSEKDLLDRIREMMNHFPDDEDYGKDNDGRPVVLSCHIVARAIAEVVGKEVKVVDGIYFPDFEHSWLKTKEGNIMDVYPVGTVGGPIFVSRIVANTRCKILLLRKQEKETGIYFPKDFPRQASFEEEWFKNAIEKITASITKAGV